MRSRNSNYNPKISIIMVLVLISLIFILLGAFDIGRYIPIFENPISILGNLFLSFYLIIIIEFIINYCFLRSADLIKKDLFISGALVNLSTFPLTQTIAYFILAFFYQYFPFYGFFIVAVMGGIEWILYRLEFQKLVGNKSLSKKISSQKTLLISIITNLGSGLIYYIYPSILILL